MLNLVGAPTTAASMLIVSLTVAGCGGDATPARHDVSSVFAPPTPVVASAGVWADADTIIVGQRVRLVLVARDSRGATLAPKAIAWTTADSALVGFATGVSGVSQALTARVDGAAASEVSVVAIGQGVATIGVEADGQRATVKLVVKPAPRFVASVEVRPAIDTVVVGQSTRFTLVTRDDKGATLAARTMRWSTVDSLVARLADTAAVESSVGGLRPGIATIVGTADGHSARAIVVVVTPIALVKMRRDTVRLHTGETTALEATPIGRTGETLVGRTIAWRSSDTTVATVSATGVVAARAPRSATIFATVDGVSASAPVTVRMPVGDIGVPVGLDLVTYDGSGQVVHPDVVRLQRDWNGHRLWMAITPYPNSNETLENPSVFGSDDGENWEIPIGAVNPVARIAAGHLSDPALAYDELGQRLRLYYRDAVGGATHVRDDVYLVSTADGVSWTAPQLVYSDTGAYVLSPSIVRAMDGVWRSWAVDAGVDGCRTGGAGVVLRTSADGRKWTASKPVQLLQPGYVPWHIAVQWVPARREFWALYAAYRTPGTCGTTDLFLATSADGVRWTTYPSPILEHGATPAFETAVYRSTFLVDTPGDSATIWFSGASTTMDRGVPKLKWSAAISRTSVAALLKRVGTPTPPHTNKGATPVVAPERMP